MERYSWMIVLAVMGTLSLIAFFHFIFQDMKRIQQMQLSKKHYVLNYLLLMVVVSCIVLAIYLYFDVQKQIDLLEQMM